MGSTQVDLCADCVAACNSRFSRAVRESATNYEIIAKSHQAVAEYLADPEHVRVETYGPVDAMRLPMRAVATGANGKRLCEVHA